MIKVSCYDHYIVVRAGAEKLYPLAEIGLLQVRYPNESKTEIVRGFKTGTAWLEKPYWGTKFKRSNKLTVTQKQYNG